MTDEEVAQKRTDEVYTKPKMTQDFITYIRHCSRQHLAGGMDFHVSNINLVLRSPRRQGRPWTWVQIAMRENDNYKILGNIYDMSLKEAIKAYIENDGPYFPPSCPDQDDMEQLAYIEDCKSAHDAKKQEDKVKDDKP